MSQDDHAFFPAALELLNRTQGRDLFAPDYMNVRTSDSKALVIGAFEDETLLALGVAQVIDNVEYYKPFDDQITSELQNKIIGSFSTLCVHEKFQGKGLGQQISRIRLDWLKEQNCNVILGISWVSGLAHTSNRVFEKTGFKTVKKVDDFFYQSSLDKPFVCPGCGEPPCTCAAILYRLDL